MKDYPNEGGITVIIYGCDREHSGKTVLPDTGGGISRCLHYPAQSNILKDLV